MIKRQTCPVCERELPFEPGKISELFPFCSERCRNVDLYRWAEGKYAIVEEIGPEIAQFLQEETDLGEV
ncbi:MAG: DNA gyrase inhibitor YacG [Planctomycetaceae bacterium]|nr:DNA gyrase inhibitor YacG [Planctomycetaceae bacterium]